MTQKKSSEKLIRDIKRNTRRKYSSEEKIRTGDFRLGFEIINDDTIRLIIIAHRKDIYRNFP